jgi:Fur family ferric uptake transcriptional regulator
MARPSRIPQQILETMARGTRHAWTLEQLTAELHGRGVAADFSSVYRAVERLLDARSLVRVGLDDGAARFELAGEHHDHLRCVRCAALVAIPCVVDGAGLDAIAARTGYTVTAHSVVLDGVCPACRQR